MVVFLFGGNFNSRPHEEVDVEADDQETIRTIFQLTTSRRGRQIFERKSTSVGHFNSRPHEEVDGEEMERILQECDFNSRPHEEVDGNDPEFFKRLLNFNSRPHEEVDK